MSFADLERGSAEQNGNRRNFELSGFSRGGRGASNNTVSDTRRISNSKISGDPQKLLNQAVQHLNTITTNNNQILQFVDKLGTNKDTHDLRERLNSMIESNRNISRDAVETLRLLQEAIAPKTAENRAFEIQHAKIQKELQAAVKRFQEISNTSAQKRKEFVQKDRTSLRIMQEDVKKQNNKGIFPDRDSEANEAQSLLQANKRQQMLQLNTEINHRQAIIEEREEEIKTIESELYEINDIMKDLSTMVSEQGEHLVRIEDNILDARSHTEKAQTELVKAEGHQKSSRTKLCIILFIILIAIAGLIVALKFIIGF